jgi:putative DNA primase/helicase
MNAATEDERVAQALGAKRSNGGWMARCPAHDDRSPSLKIDTGSDGRLLLTCFAGCLFVEIRAALDKLGVLNDRPMTESHRRTIEAFAPPPEPPKPIPGKAKVRWQECQPIELATIAAAYLEARGCNLPHPDGDLRWHPALWHGEEQVRGPALVALVTDATTREARTIHRTWLAPDGSGKAHFEKPRLIWADSSKKGGVIRLWPDSEITTGLCVAEGIETALVAARGFGLAWALIDAGNLRTLPVLDGIEALTIVADNDKAGIRGAEACAERWRSVGVEVRLWRSPVAREDLNDWARR